jgi:hypothetical protein
MIRDASLEMTINFNSSLISEALQCTEIGGNQTEFVNWKNQFGIVYCWCRVVLRQRKVILRQRKVVLRQRKWGPKTVKKNLRMLNILNAYAIYPKFCIREYSAILSVV